jgi:hypothetical protein
MGIAMLNLRLPALLTALALGWLAGGCAQPEYWIPGLSLPPGSQVAKQEEASRAAQQVPELPADRKVKAALSIGFNNASSWDNIAAHIDGCMQTAGYTRVDAATHGMDVNMAAMMRMYTREGGKYMVLLYNVLGIATEYGGPAPPNIDQTGHYMLLVLELEKKAAPVK